MQIAKAIAILCIAIIVAFSPFILISESKRIDKFRSISLGREMAYDWIKENTPENSLIMDLYNRDLVFHTDRFSIFPSAKCCGELYEFWKLPEEDALKLLHSYDNFGTDGINYIMVYTFLFQPPEILKYMAWTCIPEEFVYIANDWDSFELVYNLNEVLIYKVNYKI